MDLGIAGRVALVTGSSKGIGLEVARLLAAEGCRVAIAARGEEGLEAARAAIGRDAIAVVCDVTLEADRERLVQTVRERLGEVDILVNNAGRGLLRRLIDASPGDFESNLAINVYAGFFLARLVLPAMRERRWGRIVNVTSVSGHEPRAGHGVSNATKAAATALSKTLAEEVAADGVTVNCVLPGFTSTPQLQGNYPGEKAQAVADREIPLKRVGAPEEVAHAVVFLASEGARFITGAILAVDGGMHRSLI